MLLSVTALSETVGPVVFTTVTVPPLVVRALPLASFNCTVRVLVATPVALMLVGLAVIVEVVSDAAPGVMLTLLLVAEPSPVLVALSV